MNGFQYVCLLFTPKLSMYRITDDLAKKSKRIIVSVLQSLNSYGSLSSSAFFKIFYMKICPMLLYGCEVWGFKQYENIERIQYYSCKRFMNVSQKASNCAALGDCGRFLFVLRFYGPVNPMGSCRANSVYLTTHLLGRLSPLSG